MIHITSADLYAWITSFLWPLTRIIGVISIAPLYGNISVPARVKIALGIMLALIVSPLISTPVIDPMSLPGLLILAQQMVIGLAMGFAMRIAFAGIEMAGEISGMTMGFGFASFFDPQTRARSSAISQFLALIMLMVYLATNLHLVVLSTLVQSFDLLPISSNLIASGGFLEVVKWGGRIFSAGVQLSLPIVAALLITNIALGILTRAAPQLNIFGIGFPLTIGAGFIMLDVALPYLANPITLLILNGVEAMGRITVALTPIS